MYDYSVTTADVIDQAINLEQTLTIKNQACASKFFFSFQSNSKGLSYLSWIDCFYQFELLGKALCEAGYNLLILLQAGHGVARNFNGDNPPPLPLEREFYLKICSFMAANCSKVR